MNLRVGTVLESISATSVIPSVFGALAGMGGFAHGIGEILQGNVATDGIWIESWTEGPIAANMGGEPAMTIIPNLLIAGEKAPFYSEALFRETAAGIPNAGLILYRRMGHPAAGKKFARDVLDFLNKDII